ncbi:hypothetical protein [Qipengyuania mesophila]|uniref:hypothetical protein n=1 Tax=Qipengyuania mesophila TaxID=2867246 RepID=UPI003512484B
MTDVRLAFPEPCSESWDDMSPRGCNRHCAACDTLIHDLEAMTADEVDELAKRSEKVCVRAKIASDGTIATKATPGGKRVMAAVGASLGLSLAACQTTPEPSVTPLYTVSGTFGWGTGERVVTLTRWDGETQVKRLQPRREFTFANLRAGTYELKMDTWCADPIVQKIEVGPEHIDVGEVTFDTECIVIGVMQPVSDRRNG